MKYIQKYQKGRKTRRAYMPDFNSMPSIYDAEGNIDYNVFGNTYDQDTINKAILNARQKGWGSVNIGNKNYTLYQKNNGKIVPKQQIVNFDPNEKYTEDQLAVYNWNNRNNPSALQATSNYAVGYSPTVKEPEKVEQPVIETPTTVSPQENNLSWQTIVGTTPSSGRNSQLRTQYTQLFGNPDYLNTNKEMIGQMNKYYGLGWGSSGSDNYRPNALDELQQTANFVLGNGDLMTDRRGKGQGYLAMESSRLNRTLGNYDKLTYRDMLNYFKDNANVGNLGKYAGNNEKFMQELYELGASRNGMQEHELKRLFGEGYDEILRNIRPSNLKYGGTLRMLFI